MKKRYTISVDAMGGDNAPACVVEGVRIVSSHLSDIDFILYGDRAVLLPLMNQCRLSDKRCKIVHTTEFVKADDKPSLVVRHGRNTSMWKAIAAVRDGEADAVVSAGNTGALMVMAKFCLGTMKGIVRPAICTAIPTKKNKVVMLDLGANAECTAENLVQFAIMGSVYSHCLFRVSKPTVALLNIGSEETKGRTEIKEADEVLKSLNTSLFEYKGFAEGDDIFFDKVDVITSDGFSGNIALKTLEGTAKFLMGSLKNAIKKSPLACFGALFMIPALIKMKKRYNPKNYNGAMFIGLNGIAVKSHGSADGQSFANALIAATNLAKQDVIGILRNEIEKAEETIQQQTKASNNQENNKTQQNDNR